MTGEYRPTPLVFKMIKMQMFGYDIEKIILSSFLLKPLVMMTY